MDDKLVLAAVDAITNYLTARPAAADTVEGIHCYWIPWQDNIPELVAVTEAALLHLEQTGFVERVKAGKRDIWRRRSNADDSSS
jgi:hypothetical protein